MAIKEVASVLFVHSARPVRERVGRFFARLESLKIHSCARTSDAPAGGNWGLRILPASRAIESLNCPEPVIAYGRASQVRVCLAAGCPDFLREPWEDEELEARVMKALGARSVRISSCTLRSREISGPEGVLQLSRAESRILALLASRVETVLPRKAVLAVLDGKAADGSRVVDVYMSRLRESLARVGCADALVIESVRGKGYRLVVRT